MVFSNQLFSFKCTLYVSYFAHLGLFMSLDKIYVVFLYV